MSCMLFPEGDGARAQSSMVRSPQLYPGNNDAHYGVSGCIRSEINHDNSIKPIGYEATHYELNISFKAIEDMGWNIP